MLIKLAVIHNLGFIFSIQRGAVSSTGYGRLLPDFIIIFLVKENREGVALRKQFNSPFVKEAGDLTVGNGRDLSLPNVSRM